MRTIEYIKKAKKVKTKEDLRDLFWDMWIEFEKMDGIEKEWKRNFVSYRENGIEKNSVVSYKASEDCVNGIAYFVCFYFKRSDVDFCFEYDGEELYMNKKNDIFGLNIKKGNKTIHEVYFEEGLTEYEKKINRIGDGFNLVLK